MTFLGLQADQYQLCLHAGERDCLLYLLQLYPLVPESYHWLTKDEKLPRREENQQLLDEALKVQREQNQREIRALLNAPERFKKMNGKLRTGFTRAEVEWLLQIINDVRVGSWLALGSPKAATEKKLRRDPEAMPHVMAMELAGAFEMFFLGLLNGSLRPGDEVE